MSATAMEHRRLGRSGFRAPVLALGTALFGDQGLRYQGRGTIDAPLARRMVDICLEHGANLFDTADAYSAGAAEEMLGQAIKGRRDQVLVATKATFPTGPGANDYGASRIHLLDTVDKSLKRLGVDHIDLLHLHQQDSLTPVEETMSTLDQLVRSGKVRYVGCSNFMGWRLMKSLAVADRYGYARFISQEVYYSLLDRDFEWELMRLGAEEGVGAMIWSPLAWGRLTGRIRRGAPAQPGTRAHDPGAAVPLRDEERLYRIADALLLIADQLGKSPAQVAINWLLQRPTVATVIMGARNETQLLDNLGAAGWALDAQSIALLEAASDAPKSYPAWQADVFPPLDR